MSAWGFTKRASVVASCMIACVMCASMGHAQSIDVHGWQCVENDTRTIWGAHRIMSVEVIDGVPYTNVLLNVRSPDNAHMLMLHLQDVDRDKLTGAYTFEKKQVRSGRYVDKGDTELESMLFTVDGRVDVSLVDAMMFPPTYRYDIELYVLSHTKSRAWNEHRELYTISHPDDAIYLSGSVTLQPEFTCELGKTKWTWLINESGGAGFIPTQPSYEVEPKCLEFAGVDLR